MYPNFATWALILTCLPLYLPMLNTNNHLLPFLLYQFYFAIYVPLFVFGHIYRYLAILTSHHYLRFILIISFVIFVIFAILILIYPYLSLQVVVIHIQTYYFRIFTIFDPINHY